MSDVWDDAPSGLLALGPDGAVIAANRTLLDWVGRAHDDVVGRSRLADLLSVGGRIYWETHLSPLLLAVGRFDEVAVELQTPQGRMPVLMSAVRSRAAQPADDVVRVSLSSARQRAQYERELRAARAAADAAAARLRALQQVTAALSRAAGVDGVAGAVLSSAVGPLGAAGAVLWLRNKDGALEQRGTSGQVDGVPAQPPPTAVGPGQGAVGGDGPVAVPLHGQAELRGVLVVVRSQAPGADPLDLETLTAVGQQAGLALDRADLYERQASVASELQHSLLAGPPHADPRIGVASVYRPGTEMLEVGGDFHDVFLVADGVVAVVVGDVVGRGLGAASAMGQLRSAVRAVAGPGVGPAQLLARLDRFVDQVPAASLATLAYAELDLATGHLRYACAGHPPPLVLPRDGAPRLLWGGRSTPLSSFLGGDREEAEADLAPGDALLMYTDGLVERRDRPFDDGLRVLIDAAGRFRDLPLDEAADALAAALLLDEQARDDVCVLLARWSSD